MFLVKDFEEFIKSFEQKVIKHHRFQHNLQDNKSFLKFFEVIETFSRNYKEC